MAEMPKIGKPRKPSKYAPGKCPECGGKLDEDGECECGYGCEECEAEKEAEKKVEIQLKILLPGGD